MDGRPNPDNDNGDNLPTFTFGAPNPPTAGAAPTGGAGPNPFSFLFPSLFTGDTSSATPSTTTAAPTPGRGAARGASRGGRGGGRGGGGGGGGGGGASPFVLDPSLIPPNSPLSFLFNGGGAGGVPPYGLPDESDSDDEDSPISYAAIKEERRKNKGKVPEPDRAYILSMFAQSQPLILAPTDNKTVLEVTFKIYYEILYSSIYR